MARFHNAKSAAWRLPFAAKEPSPSSKSSLLPLLHGASFAYVWCSAPHAPPSKCDVANHTFLLSDAASSTYAKPFSMMRSMNCTISGTYSLTRVSIDGGSTCSRLMSWKKAASQYAASLRKIAGSFTVCASVPSRCSLSTSLDALIRALACASDVSPAPNATAAATWASRDACNVANHMWNLGMRCAASSRHLGSWAIRTICSQPPSPARLRSAA